MSTKRKLTSIPTSLDWLDKELKASIGRVRRPDSGNAIGVLIPVNEPLYGYLKNTVSKACCEAGCLRCKRDMTVSVKLTTHLVWWHVFSAFCCSTSQKHSHPSKHMVSVQHCNTRCTTLWGEREQVIHCGKTTKEHNIPICVTFQRSLRLAPWCSVFTLSRSLIIFELLVFFWHMYLSVRQSNWRL